MIHSCDLWDTKIISCCMSMSGTGGLYARGLHCDWAFVWCFKF